MTLDGSRAAHLSLAVVRRLYILTLQQGDGCCSDIFDTGYRQGARPIPFARSGYGSFRSNEGGCSHCNTLTNSSVDSSLSKATFSDGDRFRKYFFVFHLTIYVVDADEKMGSQLSNGETTDRGYSFHVTPTC